MQQIAEIESMATDWARAFKYLIPSIQKIFPRLSDSDIATSPHIPGVLVQVQYSTDDMIRDTDFLAAFELDRQVVDNDRNGSISKLYAYYKLFKSDAFGDMDKDYCSKFLASLGGGPNHPLVAVLIDYASAGGQQAKKLGCIIDEWKHDPHYRTLLTQAENLLTTIREDDNRPQYKQEVLERALKRLGELKTQYVPEPAPTTRPFAAEPQALDDARGLRGA